MTDHYLNIYQNHADLYERLIAREDQRGNIFQALMEIHSLDSAKVAEFGAGTGRLTRIMSVLAKFIYAFEGFHESAFLLVVYFLYYFHDVFLFFFKSIDFCLDFIIFFFYFIIYF